MICCTQIRFDDMAGIHRELQLLRVTRKRRGNCSLTLILPDGHILEFPQLRVDCFTQPSPSRPHTIPLPSSLSSYSTRSTYHEAPTAQYYFLTHAHTDHLGGLSNMHNNCTIYCSEETKALLLNYEKMADRMDYDKKMSDLQREAYKNGYGQASVEAEAKKRKIREKKLYEDLQDEVVRKPGQLDAVVKSCFVSRIFYVGIVCMLTMDLSRKSSPTIPGSDFPSHNQKTPPSPPPPTSTSSCSPPTTAPDPPCSSSAIPTHHTPQYCIQEM